MKKMTVVLALAVIAMLASVSKGAGPLPTQTFSGTNSFSWTNTGTSPAYIDRIDIRCSSVNTATVTVVNYSGITNTLVSCESTNTIVEYAPSTANVRIEKGGVVLVSFTSAVTTNHTAVYQSQR